MLLERVVFNFHEVGEKGLDDVRNECLSHFASRLKEVITSDNKRYRTFWQDEFPDNEGRMRKGCIGNYKHFRDFFGHKIKYNSKNTVFEETITNNPDNMWNVKQFCMDYYNLEYVEETQEHSGYFRYKSNTREVRNDDCCCAEWVGDLREEADNKLRDFYYTFGVGEFPFITIAFVRLGNKEYYFYTIHR